MAIVESNTPDVELIKRAQSGDAKAFQILVEKYFGLVYVIAFSRLKHRETAEDLAQEIFLRAYLFLDKFQESKFIAGWLVKATQNLAIDWLRQNQRTSNLISRISMEQVHLNSSINGNNDAREELMNREENQALYKVIFQLPVEQREIILLHYIQGMDQKKIADLMTVHPSTVGRQLKQALKLMKRSLEPVLREAVSSLGPTQKSIARTIAIIGVVGGLSFQAKLALAEAAGGAAWYSTVSLPAGGATHTGWVTGFLKSMTNMITQGGKFILTGKGITTVVVTTAILTGGGWYYHYSKSHSQVFVAMQNSNQNPQPPSGVAYFSPQVASSRTDINPQPYAGVAMSSSLHDTTIGNESSQSGTQILGVSSTTLESILNINSSDSSKYLLTMNSNSAVSSNSISKIPEDNNPPLSANALLDKYAETQDKLLSYIMKYEYRMEQEEGGLGKVKTYELGESRFDGNRLNLRRNWWGFIKSWSLVDIPKDKAEYISTLYNGKLWIQSNTAILGGVKVHPSMIHPHPTRDSGRELLAFMPTGLFMGYLEEADNEERVDATLRKAKSLKVREKPELINGSLCSVIEGVTPKGKYTIWIDPDHGYNIAKSFIERGPGDVYRLIGTPFCPSTTSIQAGYRVESSIQDVRFEKINGTWVPMELTTKYHESHIQTRQYPKGYLKRTLHITRTAITLNPDFTNMFIPDDIPDGSSLSVYAGSSKVPEGYNYTWKNGKPCDKKGNLLDFSE